MTVVVARAGAPQVTTATRPACSNGGGSLKGEYGRGFPLARWIGSLISEGRHCLEEGQLIICHM